MLILKFYRVVRKFETLHCPTFKNIRLLSTENLPVNKEKNRRKFVKPFRNEELKHLDSNFVKGLFTCTVNKEIFEYPAILREGDVNIVLDHSVEVESFLQGVSEDKLTEEILNELRRLELFGLTVSQNYGGAGYSETECKFIQECTGMSPKIGRFLGYNENYGCKILNRYGTEEQKKKYLPRLAEGKSFISLAYLENGPLIDLSKIEGYAIHDEINKHYIIKADKKWVHNADKADLFLVMVKLPEIMELDVKVKFSLFIVEKNTPGLTVHRMLSKYAEENDFFCITLNDVVVPYDNLLGGISEDGYEILKKALAYNNLTDAVLCSYFMKKIIHETTHFIEEKSLHDTTVRGHVLIKENLALLAIYTYALESTIYLNTGRFDSYKDPDLFTESILTKALALECLQTGIKKYSEILGRESLKSSGILKSALEALQYYSVFDESIEYLKMLVASEGIVHGTPNLSSWVKALRNPADNPKIYFKDMFSSEKKLYEKYTKNYNFKLELPTILSDSADILQSNMGKFMFKIEEMFVVHGKKGFNNEHAVIKFAEMAVYLYALVACLARASSSICYDFSNFEKDSMLAQAFTFITNAKMNQIHSYEMKHVILDGFYEQLGKMTFTQKQYPAEHPLSRTF